MRKHSGMNGLWERISPPGIADVRSEREAIRQSRRRLIALLFLFDALLIVATLLSFQKGELIEEEMILLETRESVEIQYTREVFTETITIIEVVPYGSVP